jgi:hypothetical protein
LLPFPTLNYVATLQAFDFLPLAALIDGVVLVLHGGIGDGTWGVDALRTTVRRPLRAWSGKSP